MIALITGGSKMTKEDIKKQVRRAFDFRMAIRVYNRLPAKQNMVQQFYEL